MQETSLAGLRTRISAEAIIALSIGTVALAIYWRALAPTITWRNQGADSGELVVAAYTLGIPHPPGYPLYTLVAAMFAHLPFGEPARNVALFSALAAAGAAILIYWMARGWKQPGQPAWSVQGSAAAAALGWAFAPLFFSQAIIAEVYALNALLVTALLAAALSRFSYRLELVAFLLGLGLSHHISILLLAPSALLLLRGMPWERKRVLRAGLYFLAPLFLYLYLPLRAAASPPINWGDPQTVDRFWWMVSAAPYRAYLFDVTPSDVWGRVAMAARLLFQQFQIWGVALGLWGVARMWLGADQPTKRQSWALALGFMLVSVYAFTYATPDSYVYLLPAFTIFAVWIAFALGDLATRLPTPWGKSILVSALLLLPGYNLVTSFSSMNLSRDRTAYEYAQNVFHSVPRDAVIFADGDEHLFALWYYRYVVAADSTQVTVISTELLQFDWYWDQIRRNIQHPDLQTDSSTERAATIVERSVSDGRSVYTTALGDPFLRYTTRREGLVSRIVGRP